MSEVQTIPVRTGVVQAIRNYLGRRPYDEVARLVREIEIDIRANAAEEKPPEPVPEDR